MTLRIVRLWHIPFQPDFALQEGFPDNILKLSIIEKIENRDDAIGTEILDRLPVNGLLLAEPPSRFTEPRPHQQKFLCDHPSDPR